MKAAQRRGVKFGRKPKLTPQQIAHYLGITPTWVDGTSVGGCSFMLHVRHAAAAIDDRSALERRIARKLNDVLLISCELRVLVPGAIERIEAGKAKRVYDRRTASA